jgi:hypothetical protein
MRRTDVLYQAPDGMGGRPESVHDGGAVRPVESADITEVARVAGRQTVALPGTGTAWFEASGDGRFRGDGGRFRGEASLKSGTVSYAFRFQEAAVIEDTGGGPIGLELSGRGRVARDGRPEAFDFTATVRPDPVVAECLIYDIVGPNVHLRFAAQSTLRVSR